MTTRIRTVLRDRDVVSIKFANGVSAEDRADRFAEQAVCSVRQFGDQLNELANSGYLHRIGQWSFEATVPASVNLNGFGVRWSE